MLYSNDKLTSKVLNTGSQFHKNVRSSVTLMCLNIGTPININFPFGTKVKVMVFGVLILKHISVVLITVTINKIGTPKIITVNILNGMFWFYNAVMRATNAHGMANSVNLVGQIYIFQPSGHKASQ